MENNWKDSVNKQRELLADMLKIPLHDLAEQISGIWAERDSLDRALLDGFSSIPYCTYLYAVGTDGVQVSSNVSRDGLIPDQFGRDRSRRPYMNEVVPSWGYLLSDAYISEFAKRPSVTALQVVRNDAGVIGYLGADFDLRNLPVKAEPYAEPQHWRQIKGDPAIRGTLFQQQRVDSPMDQDIEQSMSIMEELMAERGVFQTVIHFSSSRATIWTLDDPYRYRILDHEVLEDADICLAFPLVNYPDDALIPKTAIELILRNMRKLRMADETIYLRSASINVFNGMVSLTFSCDGSHYMRYDEFIDRDLEFWVGSAA